MELQLERKNITQKVKNPRYEIWALNDDTTTYEAVISTLQVVFGKTSKEAIGLTMAVEKQGKGLIATYTCEDVAIMKAERGMNYAKAFQAKLPGCKDAALVLEVCENGGED